MAQKCAPKIEVLRAVLVFVVVLMILVAPMALGQVTSAGQPPGKPYAASVAAGQARILDNYGRLPLSFEANRGQADAQVKFLSRTSG